MTINLNKQFVTKEGLLRFLHETDIFSHYIGEEIVVGRNIKSPFYNEKNPSFGFFLGEGNEICFNDFKLNIKGDCVKFVQMKYELTYFEALSKIALDFNIDYNFIVKTKGIKKSDIPGVKTLSQSESTTKIFYRLSLGKIKKEWTIKELQFWKDFGISLKTLQKYKVEPISHTIVNEHPIKCQDIAFAFLEHKDNQETYKIYQPFGERYKWLNSHDESIWQGWSQLPEKGTNLVITKSLKDVMSINEVTGWDAVALQSENVLPKKQVIEELKNRFENIIILYDNDYDKEENWGQIFSRRLSDFTNFTETMISEEYKSKDFSDLVKNHGIEKAKLVFENEIIIPF